MKSIAFFDFDGTITTKDTLLEFIKYSKGASHFYTGFFLNSPYLLAYKLKLISNQKAKQKILGFFFSGMPIEEFERLCGDFAAKVIPRILRPAALKEIDILKAKGARVVIVSASPANWIAGWAKSIGVELVATQLEIKGGRITGLINGINCHGEEKVRRIKEISDPSAYDEVLAYGDSPGDRPMLGMATTAFYKPFR